MLNQLIEKNKVKLSDEGTGKSKKSDKITKSKKSVIDCTRLNRLSSLRTCIFLTYTVDVFLKLQVIIIIFSTL